MVAGPSYDRTIDIARLGRNPTPCCAPPSATRERNWWQPRATRRTRMRRPSSPTSCSQDKSWHKLGKKRVNGFAPSTLTLATCVQGLRKLLHRRGLRKNRSVPIKLWSISTCRVRSAEPEQTGIAWVSGLPRASRYEEASDRGVPLTVANSLEVSAVSRPAWRPRALPDRPTRRT